MTGAIGNNYRSDRHGLRTIRLFPFVVALIVLFCLTTPNAFAVGTIAGTIINNSATATYTSAGLSHTRNSNIVSLVVDDKVSLALTSADADNVSITPSGRAYMTYILTNTGNAPHDYTLAAVLTGTPEFTPASAPRFYSDSGGTTPLLTDPNAGGFPYVSNLAPDASITIYLFITAPPLLAEGQRVTYLVTAESFQPLNIGVANPPVRSATQATVDAPASKGANPLTRYVVLADGHGSGSDRDRDGTYAVIASDGSGSPIGFRGRTMAVNLVKAQTVTDRTGSSQPVSGATIHYTLSATATGTGTATGIVVTDPVPVNTAYVAGTLRLNGTLLTDAADNDAGDVGGSAPNTVTVKLGDISSSSAPQVITFDVKIH